MKKHKKIIAMIPARMGSQRLPRKNTALIAGKPLVAYAIKAAKACPYFDQVIVNTNDPRVVAISKSYGVEVYNRAEEFAHSEARSDEVVNEFLGAFPCDVIAWVNTTSPLQPLGEITKVVDYFFENSLDALFTVYNEKVHCMYQNQPVNYSLKELFAKTQDLEPVQRFVYSVMMWNAPIFLETYRKTGAAFFCGKTGTFPVSKLTSILIKDKEDLMVADSIASKIVPVEQYELQYFKD